MQDKLENGALSVVIDRRGAEPVSVKFHGRERLWQNENGSWAGHAPVLFPVCGNCALWRNGEKFPLPKHGFARKREFSLLRRAPQSLSYGLRADGESRAVYPYDFDLTVTYTLEKDSLSIGYEVAALGRSPLYFSWGGHLSHALFFPLSEHSLLFPEEERFESLLHDGEGRLTGERKLWGTGKRLDLPEEGLKGGNTLIFAPASRSVALCRAEKKLAEVSFEGFPYLLLWRPDGAAMLCIEPWGNLPDRAGEEVPFEMREDIRALSPGKRDTVSQKITYFEV